MSVVGVGQDDAPARRVYVDGACSNNHRRAHAAPRSGGIGVYVEPPLASLRCDDDDAAAPLLLSEPLASSAERPATNVRAELTAVCRAIEWLCATDGGSPLRDADEPLLLLTDSDLVARTYHDYLDTWTRNGYVTSRGTPVANRDLVQRLERARALARSCGRRVQLAHVYAHRAEPRDVAHTSVAWRDWYGNRQADRLAVEAATRPRE